MELPFTEFQALLTTWRNEHDGIDLASGMMPSRFLIASLKKMVRQDIWEPVSLDYCHPNDEYRKAPGTSMFDGVKLTMQGSQIVPTLVKEPEKKKVSEAQFWNCLEVLKAAYHMLNIVKENIFDLHIRDLRSRLQQYPHALPNIMAADVIVRKEWNTVMQREGKTLPDVIKMYALPNSMIGTSFWTELLLHDPRTKVNPSPAAPMTDRAGQPDAKRLKREESKLARTPGRGGRGGKGEAAGGDRRGNGNPRNAQGQSLDPFVAEKQGVKICFYHAWKNDCRRGDSCAFTHSCPHKTCAPAVVHSAATAHPDEWQRVFGTANPITLVKGRGKGKGAGGKGAGGKGGRR